MNEKIGRLALREEGTVWRAYYAMPGTMEGAIPLAEINMNLVRDFPEVRDGFMELMRQAITCIIENETGEKPDWTGPERAPESERSGHA